jgi:homoserine dehydrogenase
MAETFKVGLLGHGTVGAAFERLLGERADAVAATVGLRPEVSGVLTRSRGDFEAILEGSDLIVELIGGIEPAREYVLRAMRAGKHVVSANKQLLSQHGEELWATARHLGPFEKLVRKTVKLELASEQRVERRRPAGLLAVSRTVPLK